MDKYKPYITEQNLIHSGHNFALYKIPEKDFGSPSIIKISHDTQQQLQQIQRLNNEYDLTHSLEIPGIRRALEKLDIDGKPALVLDYVTGTSLKQHLTKQALPLSDILPLMIKLAGILDQIHQQNIIHGSISSDNIIYCHSSDTIKLIDFSLASKVSHSYPYAPQTVNLEADAKYISPEQTGRMNRRTDSRADLYSLGVVFYEMLTGLLPFPEQTQMSLIYCHLAKPPPPLHSFSKEKLSGRAEIPEQLSTIILKLMAKNADERYQSCSGLIHDLKQCLQEYNSTGTIQYFQLAQKDFKEKLHISGKLYGRKSETKAIMNTFAKVAKGSKKLLMVSGYSGIGKTSLVNEVNLPITAKQGFFISGKFDIPQKNVPYAAFIQAFRSLIRQILTESEENLQKWKKQIQQKLGDHGQLIINIIPELELIIGKQNDVQALPTNERQDQINTMLQLFIRIFASKSHPLVIYIDDLQWVDPTSLKLLELLLADQELHHIMFIGAYRDNEVSPTHPLMTLLDIVKTEDDLLQEIKLKPLNATHLNALLADTLNSDIDEIQDFCTLVMKKTHGNPFFVNQFLGTLYKHNMLHFSPQQARWVWDIKQLESQQFTDNVVDLMSQKVSALSQETQTALKLASCIGHTFHLQHIADTLDKSIPQVVEFFKEANLEGLVIKPSSYFDTLDNKLHNTFDLQMAFVHDRIQEACNKLMTPEEHEQTHLQLGRTLLEHATESNLISLQEECQPSQISPIVFDISSHFDFAISLITEPDELERLGHIHILAGRKAKSSAAFEAASYHYSQTVKLIKQKTWQNSYTFMLSLYSESLEVEYATANYADVLNIYNEICNNAKSVTDCASAYKVILSYYQGASQFDDALNLCANVLKQIGIAFPSGSQDISSELLEKQLQRFRANLDKLPVHKISSIPACDDPNIKTALLVLNGIIVPLWVSRPQNVAYLFLEIVNLSLEHGHCPSTATGMGILAPILCFKFNELDLGFALGQASMLLQHKTEDKYYVGTVSFLFYNHTYYWKYPLLDKREELLKAFYASSKEGNTMWASYCINHYCMRNLLAGVNLEKAKADYTKMAPELYSLLKSDAEEYFNPPRQMVANLLGDSPDVTILTGDFYNEQEGLQKSHNVGNQDAITIVHIFKLWLLFIFNRYDEALEIALKIDDQQLYSRGLQFQNYIALCIKGLTFFQHCTDKTDPNFTSYYEKASKITNHFKQWSTSCPVNFAPMYLLLLAEQAQTVQNDTDAIHLYSEAISASKESNFLHFEAIANERAAQFWQTRNNPQYEHYHLQQAYSCYKYWGATAKLEQLIGIIPALSDAKITEPVSYLKSDSNLDLESIIKTSFIISSNIDLKRLLKNTLSIMIENAGAQKGAIILPHDQQYSVEALTDNTSNQTYHTPIPLNQCSMVSEKIIQYVFRSGEDVILANAQMDEQFHHSAYIKKNKILSVLAMPIQHSGKTLGVLYLENNLSIDVFTAKRVTFLDILLTQSAISLENALLFRKQKQTEDQLRASENKYRTLIENIPQRIFMKDSHSIYISCNASYAKDLNIKADDIAGKSDYDFYPTQLANKYRADDQEIMTIGQPKELEESYIKDGKTLTVQTIKTPVFDEQGNVTGILGIFWDITERKRVEEEHQKLEAQLQHSLRMESIGQLAGGVAHDFNNLLTGIIGSVELMKMKLDSDNVGKKLIDQIDKAATRASYLTRQLLAFSRKGKMQNVNINIHDSIDEVIQLLLRSIDKRIEISCQLQAINHTIKGDPTQLQNAILNLGVNARDAMPDGGNLIFSTRNIELDLEFCHAHSGEVSPGSYLELSVSDTGFGIPEEVKEHIFEPFFTTKPQGKGTGLGLAGVYGCIKAHNGLVRVYSEENQGSTFKLYLPVVMKKSHTEKEQAAAEITRGHGNILVIDDEDIVRDFTESVLNNLGYNTTLCEDGEKGIKYFKRHNKTIDLVILDMIMPKLNGKQVFQKLHELNPNIPVIVASGFTQNKAITDILDQGATDFIHKPFRIKELAQKVSNALSMK